MERVSIGQECIESGEEETPSWINSPDAQRLVSLIFSLNSSSGPSGSILSLDSCDTPEAQDSSSGKIFFYKINVARRLPLAFPREWILGWVRLFRSLSADFAANPDAMPLLTIALSIWWLHFQGTLKTPP